MVWLLVVESVTVNTAFVVPPSPSGTAASLMSRVGSSTVPVLMAKLLKGRASGTLLVTRARLVIGPARRGSAVMVTVAVALLASVPKLQVTVLTFVVKLPWEVVTERG